MKIACVTPFFANSAVGSVAEKAALEMSRAGHDVELIGTGPMPYRRTELPLRAVGEYGRLNAGAMDRYDAIVYHVPNDPSASPLFWLLERVPGVVVLHDRTYAHGFDGYTRGFLAVAARFERIAHRFYGDDGVAFVRRFRARQSVPADFARFTFVEPVLENSLGALVHDAAFATAIEWAGIPVAVARPSFEASAAARVAKRSDDDGFHLAYIGHVSPYRCLPMLFSVLHDRPDLRAKTRLTILGSVDDEAFARELKAQASEVGIAGSVSWSFNASEPEKIALLERADAAFNCRSLNSEGLSASLLEEMSFGLPVIVNRDGFARGVPDDAVAFVESGDMRAGIESALDRLIADASLRQRIGEAARAWATGSGSTQAYAEAMLRLASADSALRQKTRLRGRLRAIGDEMGGMPGDAVEEMAMLRLGPLFRP